MPGPRRNIELKARCADLTRAAKAAEQLGAQRQKTLVQIDTYFHTRVGRLKLRQIEGDPHAQLIAYARADSTEFRGSDYYLVPIADAATALSALSTALGVRGNVRKRRELWLWHNVRIHLDDVENLGTFIEFEAVLGESEDENQALDRLATLTRALDIRNAERVAVSYSDLLKI